MVIGPDRNLMRRLPRCLKVYSAFILNIAAHLDGPFTLEDDITHSQPIFRPIKPNTDILRQLLTTWTNHIHLFLITIKLLFLLYLLMVLPEHFNNHLRHIYDLYLDETYHTCRIHHYIHLHSIIAQHQESTIILLVQFIVTARQDGTADRCNTEIQNLGAHFIILQTVRTFQIWACSKMKVRYFFIYFFGCILVRFGIKTR